MTTEKTKNYDAKYFCKKCDFYSSKKTDYTRHLATQKHNFGVLTTPNNGHFGRSKCAVTIPTKDR
jgi:uncharacterized protein (DUF927 family)